MMPSGTKYNKEQNIKYMSRHHKQKTIHPACAWQHCGAAGEHRAPKSPEALNDYHHFCLKHVREYNKNWNFFSNMSDDEYQAYEIDSIGGHRPTWKFGVKDIASYTEQLNQGLKDFMRDRSFEKEQPAPELPANVRKALGVLDMEAPFTLKDLKKRYKNLVKTCHPDIKGKAGEARFKAITEAYHVLKKADICLAA